MRMTNATLNRWEYGVVGTGNVDGSVILQIVGYAGAGLVTVVTTTWAIATKLIDKRISDATAVLREERVASFEAARKERTDEIDASTRLAGEAMSAIREKVTQVELWGRDNYVLRSDFRSAVDGFTKSMDRINDKLDRIAEGMKGDRDARDGR